MPPCVISSRKETFELATILHGLAGLMWQLATIFL
jgi:hypothetical protein